MSKFYSIKNEKVKVDVLTVAEYLKKNGYKKISNHDQPETIVNVQDNIITIVTRNDLYNKLINLAQTEKPKSRQHQSDLIEQLTKSASRIKSNIGHLLDELEGEFYKDKKNKAYMFFSDKIVEITPEEVNFIEYSESENYVWAHDKIERKAPETIPDELKDCDALFYYFVDILIPVDSENGLDSLATAYGYILHKYKDKTNAKAWIIYDENIDVKDPDGRTGKTLLAESTRFFIETITEDGKVLRPNEKFAFSRVKEKTRIVIIDDVPPKHKFENYFSLITSDFSIEKKNKDRYAIPFSRSPKIIITSNHNLQGSGGSHKHRRIETVISNHFSSDKTPEDDYGVLFISWDDKEWSKFYCFGILCLKHYLQNGIIEQEPNKEYYLLMRKTSEQFVEFADNLELNVKYKKAEAYENFYNEYPEHFRIEQRGFTFWIKDYARYKGYKVREDHSNTIGTFEFYKPIDRDESEKAETLAK